MKVLALGGSGGMGRFAVATLMDFDNVNEVIVADINADGTFNITDIVALINIILE